MGEETRIRSGNLSLVSRELGKSTKKGKSFEILDFGRLHPKVRLAGKLIRPLNLDMPSSQMTCHVAHRFPTLSNSIVEIRSRFAWHEASFSFMQ